MLGIVVVGGFGQLVLKSGEDAPSVLVLTMSSGVFMDSFPFDELHCRVFPRTSSSATASSKRTGRESAVSQSQEEVEEDRLQRPAFPFLKLILLLQLLSTHYTMSSTWTIWFDFYPQRGEDVLVFYCLYF